MTNSLQIKTFYKYSNDANLRDCNAFLSTILDSLVIRTQTFIHSNVICYSVTYYK